MVSSFAWVGRVDMLRNNFSKEQRKAVTPKESVTLDLS